MGDLLDHIIRFSAFGILSIAALVILRRGRGTLQARLISAASLTGAGYLLCSSGTVRDSAGHFIIILQAVCLAAPWAFWLASISLFKDSFSLRMEHWAVLPILGLTGFLTIYAPSVGGISMLAHNLLAFSLFIHAVIVAWRGRGADLIESRRRFRLYYVVGVALIGMAISAGELLLAQSPAPPVLETAAAAGVLALSFLLAGYALDVDPEKLFLPVARKAPDSKQSQSGAPADNKLLAMIRTGMEERRLYREPGVTISGLALELKVPEHRLRAAINSGLGYRNFNAFVNAYRIRAVQRALRDPNHVRTPVLTLALEAGFNSIAPFNRAFRHETGMTPTEYRESEARTDSG